MAVFTMLLFILGLFIIPKEKLRTLMRILTKIFHSLKFGEKSTHGTGGMESKVESASYALSNGCSVVICNGMKYNTIRYLFI